MVQFIFQFHIFFSFFILLQIAMLMVSLKTQKRKSRGKLIAIFFFDQNKLQKIETNASFGIK